MDTTRLKMTLVAVLVCLFAVGMAGFLNYFKYRSTAEHILQERLAVTGSSVESSIRSSLALGLQLTDLGTLPGLLERERSTDDLILGIDIFDVDGKPLYSTDRLRAARAVPAAWLQAARAAGDHDWTVKNGNESAVGIPIANAFGLTIGHVALRYSEDQVSKATAKVASELALQALGVFAAAAALASVAMLAVMHRLTREFAAVEAAIRADASTPADGVRKGPFGRALRRFLDTARAAERELALLRGRLERGA